MSYPLIIFGAGASYDYSSECDKTKISPLTKNLVDPEFLFEDLLEKYPGAGDLLSDIVNQVRQSGITFEKALTEIYERTKKSETLRKQFIALEFYLRDLFRSISDPNFTIDSILPTNRRRMHQINNYRVINNRINEYSNGKACVVSFNYDTLYEKSLPSNQQPQSTGTYTTDDLKLFKLHGSHDWAYIHRKSNLYPFKGEGESISSFEACCSNLSLLNKIQTDTTNFQPYHEIELQKSKELSSFFALPALAIPLVGKDRYVCPQSHIEALQAELPKIDRVLVVGWRGADPLLLKMMEGGLGKMGYKTLIVSNTLKSAEEITETFRSALNTIGNSIEARGGGFSGFVSSPASHAFFSD